MIPTWNRLLLVEDAVKSVIAQTYAHWELIVVDDGSTDGTAEHLEALGESRLRVLSLPQTGHLGQVRNRGAAAGSGELIAVLDSDDLWLPQKLELQIRALADTDAGWSYCGFEMMDVDGQTIPMRAGTFRPLSGRILREVLSYQATCATPTLVLRRTLFEVVGGYCEDARLKTREDHDLTIRLAQKADTIAVPDILVRVRHHPGRTTSNAQSAYEQAALVYEMFLNSNPPDELARVAHRYCARELASAAKQRLSSGHLLQATVLFSRYIDHRRRRSER